MAPQKVEKRKELARSRGTSENRAKHFLQYVWSSVQKKKHLESLILQWIIVLLKCIIFLELAALFLLYCTTDSANISLHLRADWNLRTSAKISGLLNRTEEIPHRSPTCSTGQENEMEAELVVINCHLSLAGITSAVLTKTWSFSKTSEGSGLHAAVLGPRAFTDSWPLTSGRYLHLSVRRPGLWGGCVTAEGWVRHASHPKSNTLYSSVRTIITQELTSDLYLITPGVQWVGKGHNEG